MVNISTTAWSFGQGDYTPQQWQRACLIDTGQGPADSKGRYKLPVREPSGALNRNGVHAAAGNIAQAEDVSPEKRASAARTLMALYRNELSEEPPESLQHIASRSGPVTPDSWELISVAVPVFVEQRAGQTASRTIGGYGAVFNKPSENLGGYIERVAPSFFNKSRADGWPGVVCRYNHNDLYMLGATRNGTLQLSIDETGLAYRDELPESRSDIYELVQRGDLGHSSFSFVIHEQEWGFSEQEFPQRTLVSGKLIDVAPVPVPAYRDTTVALRSLAEAKQLSFEEVRSLSHEGDLRKLFIRTDNGNQMPVKPEFGPAAKMRILNRRPRPVEA